MLEQTRCGYCGAHLLEQIESDGAGLLGIARSLAAGRGGLIAASLLGLSLLGGCDSATGEPTADTRVVADGSGGSLDGGAAPDSTSPTPDSGGPAPDTGGTPADTLGPTPDTAAPKPDQRVVKPDSATGRPDRGIVPLSGGPPPPP